MSFVKETSSRFSARSALFVVWAVVVAGVVVWAGCSGDVSTPGSSTGTSSSSSGTSLPCVGPPTACLFYALPSPGMTCSVPGACCYTDVCNDMGGFSTAYPSEFVCSDAGAWVAQ